MAEGALSIVQLASQKTATLLVNVGENYLFNENAQIEKLQLGLEWMRCYLQGAPAEQCVWKTQIRDFAHEAEDIIDKYLVRISLNKKEGFRNCVSLFFWDAKELAKIGADIEAWSSRLAEFITRIRRFNSQVQLHGRPAISVPATTEIHKWPFTTTCRVPPPPSSEQEEEDRIIVGLDEEVKNLAKLLVSPFRKVIHIYGPSGSGKTTLAKKVCNDESVKGYFDTMVWINGSKKIGAREALETIWLNLRGGDYHDQRKRIKRLKDEEIQSMIKVELEKNKYLIVFDNVRIEGSWAILRPALPVPRNSGSKLLLPTSYRVELSQLTLSDYRYSWQMKPLKEVDSWKLLSHIASKGGYQTDERMHSSWKDKIARFDGLIPLSVMVLGGVLQSKKTRTEWDDVLKEIPVAEQGFLLKALDLSYNDLPFHLKCCYVRLANLPPGFEIPVNNLYHMWVAEELVTPHPDESTTPHDKAKAYLHELVKRCLIQIGRKGKNGEIETCSMHGFVREFCLRKEKEEYISSLTSVAREVDKIKAQNTKAAAAASKEAAKAAEKKGLADKKSATTDSKKTAAAAANKPSTTVNLSVRRLHHLAVHQYIGRRDSQREVLGAIEDREHLRSLLIFSSRFKVLPRNSWLKSLHGESSMLRVLHIEDTKIRTLPHQIGELSHLRYLSLRGTKVTRALPSSIGNLLMLETLDLRAYGSYGMFYGIAMHGNGDCVMIPNVMWKLKSLLRLYLPESYMVAKLRRLKVHTLTQLETLENLELRSCKVTGLAKLTGLKNFTWTIQESYGMFQKSDKNILEGLLACPSLETQASVHRSDAIETSCPGKYQVKMNGEMLSKKFAEKLGGIKGYKESVQGLTIWGPIVPKLEEVKRVFNNLTSIVLRLTQLGEESDPMRILGDLPDLEKLRLSYLSYVGTKIECSPNGFQKLVYLKLDLLPELQTWTVGENSMPKLEHLEIEYCDKLRQIPDSVKGKAVVTYSRPADQPAAAAAGESQPAATGAGESAATGAGESAATGAGKSAATGAGESAATGAGKSTATGASESVAAASSSQQGQN